MSIVKVALPVRVWSTFDYWVPDGLAVVRGTVIRVPLAGRNVVGIAVDAGASSDVSSDKLQPIGEVIDLIPPLPEDVLAMAEFVSRYYQQPPGLVLAQMLPPLPSVGSVGRIAKTMSTMGRAPARDDNASASPPLNAPQRAAAETIERATGFAPILLQGVTGSGKTEVYLAAAARVIAAGGQVLVLVPEINLTPQLEQRVEAALPGRCTVTLHSRLAAGMRRRGFIMASRGAADLVLGTRLAVFTPLPRLRLIVIDEEHDASFKQQDNVRYHGRDVAIWRAHQCGVPIVLGTATPSLETLVHARSGRYRWLKLATRAVAAARMPSVIFTPARSPATHDGLGSALLSAIEARLHCSEQSLIFINRRGFAPSLLCTGCNWRAECLHCSARLVVHRETATLRCHHCGHVERLPRACPQCGNVDLLPVGQGTQRLEDALRKHFPSARIARIDRDTTARKGAFTAVREQVHAGTLDILVGTQMLAKGHDFPRLTLVGVLGADNALYSADLRATERLGALLFQVAGRAGRATLAGEVIVQTDFPRHAVFQALAAHDFDVLADALLAERRVASMPPYTRLTILAAEAPTRAMVDAFLERSSVLGRAQVAAMGVPVDVFAPVPAMLAKRAGMERGQVLVQSVDRGALQRFLPGWRAAIGDLAGHRVRWVIDVDPLGFL